MYGFPLGQAMETLGSVKLTSWLITRFIPCAYHGSARWNANNGHFVKQCEAVLH